MKEMTILLSAASLLVLLHFCCSTEIIRAIKGKKRPPLPKS